MAFQEPKLGQLKEGFLADILITDSDPSLDISALRTVYAVMTKGHLHTREYLLSQ